MYLPSPSLHPPRDDEEVSKSTRNTQLQQVPARVFQRRTPHLSKRQTTTNLFHYLTPPSASLQAFAKRKLGLRQRRRAQQLPLTHSHIRPQPVNRNLRTTTKTSRLVNYRQFRPPVTLLQPLPPTTLGSPTLIRKRTWSHPTKITRFGGTRTTTPCRSLRRTPTLIKGMMSRRSQKSERVFRTQTTRKCQQ